MKRTDLLRHLHRYECELIREGAKHSKYRNPANNKQSVVPRHNEVNDITAENICKDLGIPKP